MISNPVFVGLHLSAGRKPVTSAVLDDDLNVVQLAGGELSDLSAMLSGFKSALVCIASGTKSGSLESTEAACLKELARMSFRPYGTRKDARQWFKTRADQSYGALLGHKLFSRRSLEGRIQRALILYDQGLRIHDPMDFYEEITRYRLMQGILPLENIYSTRELDALIAAYVAWMTANRPQAILVRGDLILPGPERIALEQLE